MEITMNEELGINEPLFKKLDPKVITITEYEIAMDQAGELIREDYNTYYRPVSKFQDDFMHRIVAEYETHGNPIREYVSDLLKYVVDNSETGNSIIDVPTEDTAEEVKDQLYKDFGDMVLDIEVYENCDDDTWSVDAMFGGTYVPFWDGWLD